MHVLITLASFAFLGYVIWYWTAGPGRGLKRKNIRRTSWDRFMGQQRSEMVPKKGWWYASDGKLYPPEQHPNYRPPPPPPTQK